MMMSDKRLREVLRTAKTIAVVGASPRPQRPSNIVARYLIQQGYTVIPVRPGRRRILDLPCYKSLTDIPGGIDIVNVFRHAEACPEVAREAVAVGARVLWLQQGIVSKESARIARDGGLDVIMGRCIKTVHQELGITKLIRQEEKS